MTTIGVPRRRRDGEAKVRGQTRFVSDMPRATLEKVAKNKLRELLQDTPASADASTSAQAAAS